jgi:hypothetical protein
MKIQRVLAATILMSALVTGSSPARAEDTSSSDQTAVGEGTFVGSLNITDCQGQGILTCKVDGSSTLCFEAIAGSSIGTQCGVSITGSISIAVGLIVDDQEGGAGACLGVGDGTATISSASGSYLVPIVITVTGAGGSFSGAKPSPPSASIKGAFVSPCKRQGTGGVGAMSGSYEVVHLVTGP